MVDIGVGENVSVAAAVAVNWISSGVAVGASDVGVSVGASVPSVTSVGVGVKVRFGSGVEVDPPLVAMAVALGLLVEAGDFAAAETVDSGCVDGCNWLSAVYWSPSTGVESPCSGGSMITWPEPSTAAGSEFDPAMFFCQ